MDIIFLIGRILLASYFLNSGIAHFRNFSMVVGYASSKGVWRPKTSVAISGLILILGSLGIILGAFINLSVLFLALFLIPVTFQMHKFWKVQDPQQRMAEKMNFMRNIAFLGAVLILLFVPTPWPYAINLTWLMGY